MPISDHAETLVITASNRTTGGGAVTLGSSWIASKTDSILAMTGPEVLNACALIGAAATVVGMLASVYFQWRRNKREQTRHNLMVNQMKNEARARDEL